MSQKICIVLVNAKNSSLNAQHGQEDAPLYGRSEIHQQM